MSASQISTFQKLEDGSGMGMCTHLKEKHIENTVEDPWHVFEYHLPHENLAMDSRWQVKLGFGSLALYRHHQALSFDSKPKMSVLHWPSDTSYPPYHLPFFTPKCMFNERYPLSFNQLTLVIWSSIIGYNCRLVGNITNSWYSCVLPWWYPNKIPI